MEGTVFWITGLSGAGKTTVGELLYERMKQIKDTVIFLDGDILREVFGDDLGYTYEERYKSAARNARICRLLASQGMDVVCCTISMFEDIRKWNREHNANYMEIYLKASLEILRHRNQKNLYVESENELVGLGVNMEEPKNPDMMFINDGNLTPEEIVDGILAKTGNIL